MDEGGPSMAQRSFSKSRQFDTVSLSHKKFDAKRFFQRRERLAHPGLGDTRCFCSSGEATGFGDGNEASELC
jgi:hypothetical protein